MNCDRCGYPITDHNTVYKIKCQKTRLGHRERDARQRVCADCWADVLKDSTIHKQAIVRMHKEGID